MAYLPNKMNDISQIPLDGQGNVQELNTELLHQTLSFDTDCHCADSELTTQSFFPQCQTILHTSLLNTDDETAYNLPSFPSTSIDIISLNVNPLASYNNMNVNQTVNIDNVVENGIGSMHNYSELIDVSNNVGPANLLELSEVSEQKVSPAIVSSTHQLEEEVETRKQSFLSTPGIANEIPPIVALERYVNSISRTKENICSVYGNAFVPKTKMDQHNVVLSGCICRRNVIPLSFSYKTMFPHTEDVISVTSPSNSQLFISDKKQKSLIKNCNLQRNMLINEINTCPNKVPEVAISSGTQHHKHADLLHNSSVKRHSGANTSVRTSRDMAAKSSPEDLKSKVSSISELKGHICQECGKNFIFKSHLKRHSIVHTRKKPFVCNFCEKSFTQKVGLNEHKRIHHPEIIQM